MKERPQLPEQPVYGIEMIGILRSKADDIGFLLVGQSD
jgi:hypothetical protein